MFCLITSSKLSRLYYILNFHPRWRWWHWIQAIFLNLFYSIFNFGQTSNYLLLTHQNMNSITWLTLTYLYFRQWCYWQVTRLTDGDYDKYSTFHDHPGVEALYNDDGIKFSIRSKICAFSQFSVCESWVKWNKIKMSVI